jgi:GTP cyclohydrolase I
MEPALIEKHFRKLMEEGLGSDLKDPNLKGTPERISRMYNEFLKGEGTDFEGLTVFPNTEGYDEIVLLDNIHFVSMCSHHLLPFSGLAWVAYIPNEFLLGASKPSRVIAHYGARLQLQENLSEQVVNFIEDKLKPKALMIILRAVHGCMSHRGANQYAGAGMMTSAVRGVFKTDPSAKAEALDLVKMSISLNK